MNAKEVTQSTIRFPNISGSSSSYSTTSETYTLTGRRTFYIEADQITEGLEGAHAVTMELENVRLISAEITNRPYTKSGTTIALSSLSKPSRSSVVDFSKNVSSKPEYNSNLLIFGSNTSGAIDSNTTYSSSSWKATGGNNNFWDKQMYSKNDFYFLMEDINDVASSVETCWNIGRTDDTRNTFPRPGLTRIWSDYTKQLSSTGFNVEGQMKFLYAGFTQPINSVLYEYGIDKGVVTSTTDNYVNPSDDFNRKVLKKLTTDACKKLKDAGVRIYVIKYKAQNNWGALTKRSSDISSYDRVSTAHSYTEIENGAISTGGDVYSANNRFELENVLETIAERIKKFANYQNARNVD